MPAWIFIGVAAVLLPIFAIMTAVNINRQKDNTQRLLVEKGAALIRSFEAGTRTGMMGRMRSGFKLQHLLSETAQQPDIIYLLVTDIDGTVLAHSDLNRIGGFYGENLDFETISEQKIVQWHRVQQDDGREIFEVYRRFYPTERPKRRPPERLHPMMRHRPPDEPDFKKREKSLPAQFIFVGLDTSSIATAQKADTVHTVVMGVILLFIGLAGILLLFLAQSYRATRTTLNRIKAFSDNLVENMPIGLLATDNRQRIASFNQVAQSILGFAPEKAIGRNAGRVLPQELFSHLDRLVTDKGVIEKEIELVANDGRRIPLEVIATQLHDADGTFLGYVLLLRDLREIHLLRREILRNQRLASVGRLAAGVAHEIRNPLSSIKGFATYFKERYPDKEDDQQIANIMIKEVERMDKVIGQLLDFARPIKISKKIVLVPPLIENSLKLLEPQAAEKKIEIQTRFAPQIRKANVDPDLIGQVLLNLYLNALDAMDNGGRLTVAVTDSTNKNRIAIIVSDSGRGISNENLAKIFDPYFTTKSTGTGLGLAIAHNIITAHGGKITVDSSPGQGTAFTVLIPPSGEDTPTMQKSGNFKAEASRVKP